MTDLHNKAFSTRAVHAGENRTPGNASPVTSSIVPSVSYTYQSMDDLDAVFANSRPGFIYSRYTSPTVAAFESAVATLEDGEAAIAFSSGMAAIQAALLAAGVHAGTRVVSSFDVYGATYSLLVRFFSTMGVSTSMVDVCDLAAVEAALKATTPCAVLVETISNPLLKVADIPALAELAHRYGAQLLVDNTFATPCLFRPLLHGADYVIHSATKYLSGHGDVLAGVVVTSAANRARMFETNKLLGSNLGPFEAWLALRGLKTLPLRMRQQCSNALHLAGWLAGRPEIALVNYPGLATHPQYALAQRLFNGQGSGGVFSFEIRNAGRADIFRFMEALQLCLPATSLGDIYTLVLHPATSSHRSLTPAEREQVGITEGLLRLSAGIEDPLDIRADLEQALKRLKV
ncbi:MAG: PLP-dependent aspartate aminotransferase family protein [Anaerolineales bacterium]